MSILAEKARIFTAMANGFTVAHLQQHLDRFAEYDGIPVVTEPVVVETPVVVTEPVVLTAAPMVIETPVVVVETPVVEGPVVVETVPVIVEEPGVTGEFTEPVAKLSRKKK